MKSRWLIRGLKFLVWAAVALAIFGLVVMLLWNKLMPALFGWKVIGFWQALGLLILSWILFGGFRGRAGRSIYWRQHMVERWEQMTPEERARFREGLRSRCGGFEPPPKPTD
jgi:hypothetical protein